MCIRDRVMSGSVSAPPKRRRVQRPQRTAGGPFWKGRTCSAATATYAYAGRPLSRRDAAPTVVRPSAAEATPTGEMEQQWPTHVHDFESCDPFPAATPPTRVI